MNDSTDLITCEDVLTKAADEMFVRGKTESLLENSQGQVCAMGAIRRAIWALTGRDILTERAESGYQVRYRVLWDESVVKLCRTVIDTYSICDGAENIHVSLWSDNSDEATVIAGLRDAGKIE